MKLMVLVIKFLLILNFVGCKATNVVLPADNPLLAVVQKDSVAERMLLYQRENGGWCQPGGNAINYDKQLSESEKNTLIKEKSKLDATIDDQATTREIKYLVTVFKKTQNKAYLNAAENGIKYLLSAQNLKGGWGQFYPDSSSYRKYITFNDNAMIDVLWVMKFTSESINDFEVVEKSLIPKAKLAVEKGLQCILNCQIKQGGVLTAWCAQHHNQTLLPAKARAFELASISGNETVGILRFLMSFDNPTPAIKSAIDAACTWLDKVKIVGYKVIDVQDSTQPSGKDRIVVADPNSTIWARFYDIESNKPFFTGRDSVPKATLAEIENERRVGYAYYGTWPASLLSKDYPAWKSKWR